jgi:hypothetical protein
LKSDGARHDRVEGRHPFLLRRSIIVEVGWEEGVVQAMQTRSCAQVRMCVGVYAVRRENRAHVSAHREREGGEARKGDPGSCEKRRGRGGGGG